MANVNCVAVSLRKGSLTVGETTTAYVDVCPENACYEVAWESSNPCVASVSSLGVVFANCAGRVKIIASVTDVVSGKVTTAFNWLVVSEPSSGTEDDTGTGTGTTNIPVQSVTVCPPTMELTLGESAVLDVTVCPENATNSEVTWSSSNTNVAVVNPQSGLIVTQRSGDATIYATACDGSGLVGCCFVRVSAPIMVECIKISSETLTMSVGETTRLTAEMFPANANNKEIRWFSENCNIVDVNPVTGYITAKSIGTTCICANAQDGSGVSTCCSVTVVRGTIEETVSALSTRCDCYIRIDTLIDNDTNDTRLKNANGSSVVLRADSKDKVQLLQMTPINSNGEDWYQVLYEGMIVYVTVNNFDVTTMVKPTFCGAKNMRVNTGDGSNLNVRNKPYFNGELLGNFADHTIVQVMDTTPQKNNWYPVYGQLNDGTYSYGWCLGDYLSEITSDDSSLSDSRIQEILNNIRNCSTSIIPANRKDASVATAEAMLNEGYAPSFVAGMIANIVFEGATGQFESSRYISNLSAKPDYLVYMDSEYNGIDYYLHNYSGKTIMDVNVLDVYSMLHSLKTSSNGTWRINGSRVGFGLGSIQWTFSRSYTLIELYLEVNNNTSTITREQTIEAEKLMIMRELKSSAYKGIVSSWMNKCDDINSAVAANNAGADLCNSYLRPADSTQAQKRGARAETIYSVMMTSVG